MRATGRTTAPRDVASVALVLAAAVLCAALGLVTPLTGAALLLADTLAVLATGGGAWVLRERTRREPAGPRSERDLWSWFTRVLVVVAGGAVVRLALDAGLVPLVPAGAVDELAALVWGAAALATMPLSYRALVQWNLARGPAAEAGDWLNGLSAVFAVVAVAVLGLSWQGSHLMDRPDWAVHGSLFRIAASVVLVGTVLTVAQMGGLRRDPRVWALGSAFAVVGAAETAALVAAPGPAGVHADLTGWVVLAAVLAACTLHSPRAVPPRHATPQGPTLGALAVLVVSVAVLVANSERLAHTDTHGTAETLDDYAPAAFAVVAVLGVTARMIHFVRDLAQLAQSRHEARTDDLTGVANRRALMAHLTAAVGRSTPVSLLVLDLDRLKDVNDRYGHAAGDALLRSAASCLDALLPPGSLLARLGGDEFAVVLPGDEVAAVRTATTLTEGLTGVTHAAGQGAHVLASIGVATGAPGIDADELLRRADVAMYRAKATGTRLCRYDADLDRATRARATRLEELRAALDPAHPARRERFVLHYQPQVDVARGTVSGVEALVRWDHPVHGLLAPDRFLDLVEQDGLMAELTTHVLWTAARQAATWAAAGVRWRVAVNLSTSVLTHPGMLPLLDDVLAGTGIDPDLLVLEVTETTLMVDAERGLAAARAVTRRGVALSIDDYGTGHSSLSSLNDLPVTELKLDRSFVARLCTDPRTAAIVAATVELAHRLGLRLVAEGVEDAATLRALEALGCDESQGFLHARPQPADALAAWTPGATPVPSPRGALL